MQINKILRYFLISIFISFIFNKNINAFIVYDPTNWLQNATTAANTAQELVKQTQQLEIALKEIKNYDGNIGQWANIQNLLQQLGEEVQQGQALSYMMPNLDSQFKQTFPGYSATLNYQKSYLSWSQTALDTMRSTLESAGMQAREFGNEQTSLNQLAALSQSAQGRMQALQVSNMIATQEVSHLQKLRQLVIDQVNAQNTYAAFQIQKDQSSEASAASWIHSSETIFPRYGSNQHPKLDKF
jgi:P-type conjugative transfer protein TrbJ